jgi:hypothetical protein
VTTTESAAAFRWLIAEYEAVDLDGYISDDAPGAVRGPGGSVYVQPIFTLKRITDSGNPMRVRQRDYLDPARWWL